MASLRTRYDGDIVQRKGDAVFVLADEDSLALGGGIHVRRGAVDEIARFAAAEVAKDYPGFGRAAQEHFASRGLSDEIQKVTDRLNKQGLTDAERLVLSDADVYGALLLKAAGDLVLIGPPEDTSGNAGKKQEADDPIRELVTESEHIAPADTNAMIASIKRNLRAENYLSAFEGFVVNEVFRRNDIRAFAGSRPTDAEKAKYGRVLSRVRAEGLSLAPGAIEPLVLRIQREVAAEGKLPTLIDAWATLRGVERRITDDVMERMVQQLQGYGLDLDRTDALRVYADTFAIAYDTALRGGGDSSDPIALARPQAMTLTPWDFRVETFEAADEQGILPENVRAAGALDYVWWLGEVLGVYKLTDALVLRWAAGMVDISDAAVSSKLYRYWQLREDRIAPEERGMLYKRVFNRGDTSLLSRMAANEQFEPLWHKLMEKVADYIDLTADALRETAVSKVPIERAVRDLQFNLTENMTGMAHLQVTDMYMQLKDAFELLGAPEIASQLSMGRRRTVWTTIERLSREELETVPDIAGLRTLAVEGNKVFQFIGNFEPGSVSEADFEAFRDSAEAWIIAAATSGQIQPPGASDEQEEDDPWAEEEDPDFRLDDEVEEDAW